MSSTININSTDVIDLCQKSLTALYEQKTKFLRDNPVDTPSRFGLHSMRSIGTGLAELPKRAPRLFAFTNRMLAALEHDSMPECPAKQKELI
jgi:hypothetical protein